MDRLESLSNTLQNITLYDIKSMYNQVCLLTCFMFPQNLLTILTHQAKNVVLNISEMEAKVREATNDDPWCVKSPRYQESRLKSFCRGASSTLMQEIAQGYVPFVIRKYNMLTSFKDFPFVRSPFYLQALVLIYSNKIVNTSTKLCPVSIRVSWRKKLNNGGRFTRFGSLSSFYQCL